MRERFVSGSARVIDWLSTRDIFLRILQLRPSRAYVIAIGIGALLAVWSALLGVAAFRANVDFSSVHAALGARDIALGYMQQLSYGLWYLTGGPLLSAGLGRIA